MNTYTKLFALILIIYSNTALAQTYTWTGAASNDFNTATNWTPSRTSTSTNDTLVFATGNSIEVANVSSQTISGLAVTNNTDLTFSAVTVHKALTIQNANGTDVLVEEGSTLTFKDNGGVRIDVEMASGSSLEIGGTVTMERGTFNFNDASLTLHTTTTPLAVVSGSFNLEPASMLAFGKTGKTPNGQIVLPNDVFTSAPEISDLVVNSADGVKLGNQPITISNTAIFIDGDLETNSLGRLIFIGSATDPIETEASKIVGFAEMEERTVGTGSLSFFGYSVDNGIDDIGNVSIVRMTGPAGVNFYNDSESVAVTWDVNVDNQPENGRDVTMQWFADFDNGNDVNTPMQMYRYTNGTEWEVVGGATAIASNVDNFRTSATITTTHFSQWTISSTDNALPVSLINFAGESKGGDVVLNWATASEVNNDRFEVERMEAGQFVSVGSVKGNGTTSEVKEYELIDANASEGNNHYRLVQYDLDGKFEIFETITVEHVAANGFDIFPNPSSGNKLTVNLDNNASANASIKLYNSRGTLILERYAGGMVSIDVLDGKELSKGLYYIEYINNGTSNKRRVIVR